MHSEGTRKQQPVDESPVMYDEVKEMMRGLLRYHNLLRDAARVGLDASHFTGPGEIKFQYLFSAMAGLYTKHGELTQTMLVTELRAWHAAELIPIGQEDFDWLVLPGGFIDAACAAEPDEDDRKERAGKDYIEAILRRFMNARMLKHAVQTIINRGEGVVVAGLDTYLQEWTQQARSVQYLGRVIDNAAVMPDFGSRIVLPPPAVPTSLPWIDQYITGFRAGDMIGVLGPFSGGKTTLLACAAVRLAEQFSLFQPNKLSVFIGYEDGAAKMNHMFWSAAAHVDRNLFSTVTKLATDEFWAQFSTRETLKDYDRTLPENKNGQIILGEFERWNAAIPWINKHFVFLDFSENASTGGHGSGGVPEIAAVLEQLCESRNMNIGFVAIDYSGLLINRDLAKDTRMKNVEQIWRPLQQLPDNLRKIVAVPFDCTVMLAHQLAGGDIKKIPAHRYVSHLDASGSKSFAENLHACISVNTRDIDTRVSTINWSKIRVGVPAKPFGLIRMDDCVVDVRLVNDEYVACETSRKIMRRGEVSPMRPSDVASSRFGNRARSNVDQFSSDFLQ